MKFKLLFLIGLLLSISFYSQSGCTDIQATNYNSGAISNDGSCVYPITNLNTTLKVNTPGVTENSGIEWINGSIFTFGDSGNPSDIYKIDTITGAILQTIHVTNYSNTDWEDITADSAFIYIDDAGNNNGDRTDLKILKIAKSQFITSTNSTVNVTAQAINFSYTDQTSFSSSSTNNFDCESLISVGDSLYIFTKDRGDFETRVYCLPKNPGTYAVSPYTNYNVNGKICGADYNPINNEVLLIGYMNNDENSFIWVLSDFAGTDFFSGNKRRLELGNTSNAWQTEGITFYNETSTHRIFISNEDNHVTAGIYVADISSLSTNTNTGIKVNEKKNEIDISYLSDNSISVFCKDGIKSIELISLLGEINNTVNVQLVTSNEVNLKGYSSENTSISILKLHTNKGETFIRKILY